MKTEQGAGGSMDEARTCTDNDAGMTQESRLGSLPVRGHIYFVRAGDAIKIGFSRNIPNRVAALQTSNAENLEPLGSFRGTSEDERKMHETFCHLKIRGEWFHATEDLVDYIRDKTWRKPRLPAPSRETIATIKDLIKKRSKYGGDTPIGHRHSNLIEQLRNYEHSEGDQRTLLAEAIATSIREISELKRQPAQ